MEEMSTPTMISIYLNEDRRRVELRLNNAVQGTHYLFKDRGNLELIVLGLGSIGEQRGSRKARTRLIGAKSHLGESAAGSWRDVGGVERAELLDVVQDGRKLVAIERHLLGGQLEASKPGNVFHFLRGKGHAEIISGGRGAADGRRIGSGELLCIPEQVFVKVSAPVILGVVA